jgi:hypothetical protein
VTLILASLFIRLISRPISDALAYYLVQPKLIALTHQLTTAQNFESFLQSSAFIELNSAGVFFYSGEVGIRFYLLFSGIILLKVVWEICQQLRLNRLSSQLVLFFMATSTFLTNTMADGKTDNLSTLWFMASFSLLLASMNEWNEKFFVLFWLILSFAVLSKISFAVMIPSLLIYFFSTNTGRSRRAVLVACAYVTLGFSLPIIINCLKNLVVFSDPFAPFISRFSEQSAQLLNQEWFSPENTKWIIISYPFALFFGQYPMQYGNITPFLLLGVPLLFTLKNLAKDEKRKAQTLFVMGFVPIVLWLLVKPSVIAPRYIGPAFILIMIAVGFFASKNIEKMLSQGLILILVLAHLSLNTVLSAVSNDTRFYLGSKSPEILLYDHLSTLRSGSDLIYLSTYNSSMLDNNSLECSSVIHQFVPKVDSKEQGAIWVDLYAQGFRFVVSDESTHESLESERISNASSSPSVDVTPIHFSDSLTLYTIKSTRISEDSEKVVCGQQ